MKRKSDGWLQLFIAVYGPIIVTFVQASGARLKGWSLEGKSFEYWKATNVVKFVDDC